MRRKAFRAILLALGAVAAASGGAAQETDRPWATFFAPVEVPLVSVDVFVSERDGRPVPGLTVDDFEIFEDGKKVTISHFFASPGVAAPEDSDEKDAANAPFVDTGPAQKLYLVIYFDDTNLVRGRRQAAVEHLRTFLSAELPPDLSVMLVRYDGRNHIEVPFTEETDEVLVALDSLRDSASLTRSLQETMLLREIQNAASLTAMAAGGFQQDVLGTEGRHLWQAIDSFVEQTVHRTRTGIENQERIIRSLSGLKGRKAVLLVSDGVEPRPGELLYRSWAQAFQDVAPLQIDAQRAFLQAARNDLSNEFDNLARFANAHRVSLYTLGAPDAGVARAMSAETRSIDEERLMVVQGMSADVLMAHMAGTTGGRPLVNSSALAEQLDEVSEELASYYSLAFEPQHLGDGKYHRLEVKVNRSGVRVRHREGYMDVPLAERITDRTLAAAVHGVADNPMGIFAATVDGIIERDDGTFLVPVIVTVPIGELVLIPAEEAHQGKISILITVRDQRGDLSKPVRREYPVVIPNNVMTSALGQVAGYTMRLAVRSGTQRIAIGLRDEVARTESVTVFEVEVGDDRRSDGG